MSYLDRRVAFISALLLGLGVWGCDQASTELGDADNQGAGGKADDTNTAPIGSLGAGTSATGSVAGDAIHLYVVAARPGSVVTAAVERTSGDLDPTAFLYQNLRAAQAHDFMRPTHGFRNTASLLKASWEVPSGELLLIVAAAAGSAGDFSVDLTCHEDSPVPCTANGVDDEIAACEFVRDTFARCMESEDQSDEACGDWLSIEDTTQDEDCCELWVSERLPGEDFCP